MKNFKNSVPLIVQSKLKMLAAFINDNLSNVVTTRYEAQCESRVSEIEGNYVSGWNPRQDGGFEVSQFVQSDIDSSYHFTQKQTDYVQEQSAQCYSAFFSDNGIDEETQYCDLTEEQKEQYYEYEREWFQDGALLQIQMFASGYPGGYWEEKEQTITVRVSINYSDAPYFREGSAEDIKTLILTEAEFLDMGICDLIIKIKI